MSLSLSRSLSPVVITALTAHRRRRRRALKRKQHRDNLRPTLDRHSLHFCPGGRGERAAASLRRRRDHRHHPRGVLQQRHLRVIGVHHGRRLAAGLLPARAAAPLWQDVAVLAAVHVEVDGAVHGHEEVADVRDGLYPRRPGALVRARQPRQLVQVGYPLHAVAQYEDEDDGQADLGQRDLVLPRRHLAGVVARRVLLEVDQQAVQGEAVEDDEHDEGSEAHEGKVHPDAVDLDVRLVNAERRRLDGEGAVGRAGLQLEELWRVVEEGEEDDGDDVATRRPVVLQREERVTDGEVALDLKRFAKRCDDNSVPSSASHSHSSRAGERAELSTLLCLFLLQLPLNEPLPAV